MFFRSLREQQKLLSSQQKKPTPFFYDRKTNGICKTEYSFDFNELVTSKRSCFMALVANDFVLQCFWISPLATDYNCPCHPYYYYALIITENILVLFMVDLLKRSITEGENFGFVVCHVVCHWISFCWLVILNQCAT